MCLVYNFRCLLKLKEQLQWRAPFHLKIDRISFNLCRLASVYIETIGNEFQDLPKHLMQINAFANISWRKSNLIDEKAELIAHFMH